MITVVKAMRHTFAVKWTKDEKIRLNELENQLAL